MNMSDKKKMKAPLLLLSLLILLSLLPLPVSADNSYESNGVCAVYITGIGCPNCAITDPALLTGFTVRYPDLVVIEYEIYHLRASNQDTANKYLETFFPAGRPGVPFLIFNKDQIALGKFHILDSEEIIKTLDLNECPLPDGSSIGFDNLNLSRLPGRPNIWVRNRILIKTGEGKVSDRLLKDLLFRDIPGILEENKDKFREIEAKPVEISGSRIEFDRAIKLEGWVFEWKEPLFTLPLEFRGYLDKGNLSELRKKFREEEGIPLSRVVIIPKEEHLFNLSLNFEKTLDQGIIPEEFSRRLFEVKGVLLSRPNITREGDGYVIDDLGERYIIRKNEELGIYQRDEWEIRSERNYLITKRKGAKILDVYPGPSEDEEGNWYWIPFSLIPLLGFLYLLLEKMGMASPGSRNLLVAGVAILFIIGLFGVMTQIPAEYVKKVGGYSFSLPLKFKDDLEKGTFSEELRKEFEEYHIYFSGETEILHRAVRGTNMWKIEDKEKSYNIIEIESGALEVYGKAPLSFPLFTFIIAIIDGFNPCNLFVLTVLLGYLTSVSHSRKRIYLVGYTFVLVVFLIYFTVMVLFLNVLQLIGFIDPLRITIGLIALVAGIINCKELFAFRKGISLMIPTGQVNPLKERINKLGETIKRGSLPALFSSSIILATFASLVELPCTAGFPLIYTGILSGKVMENSLGYYLYLLLYNLVYVIPLIVIIAIFGWTFRGKQITQRQMQIIKFVGGLIMILLGITLLVNPALIGLGFN